MSAVLDAHIEARNAEIIAKYDAAPDKSQVIDPTHYLDVVLQDRAARYAAHLATMDVPPEIVLWAMGMTARYKSSYVKCWHFVADWITALLILVDGEECDPTLSEPKTNGALGGWPTAFTAYHLERAAQLLKGEKWPADRFTLLPVEG